MTRFCCIVCLLWWCAAVNAQITFGGCVSASGYPVLSRIGQVNDVAAADPLQNVIFYNPYVLSWLQPATRLFFYAHECAHLALPTSDETVADCWAARTLRDKGLLNRSALRAVQADINRFAPGDWTHLPGPERSIVIDRCFGPDLSEDRSQETVETDSEDDQGCDSDGSYLEDRFERWLARATADQLRTRLRDEKDSLRQSEQYVDEAREDLERDERELAREENLNWNEELLQRKRSAIRSDKRRLNDEKESVCKYRARVSAIRYRIAQGNE